MRTAAEIAKELTEVEQELHWIGYTNVAGATSETLQEIAGRKMELEKRLMRLRNERAEWIAT